MLNYAFLYQETFKIKSELRNISLSLSLMKNIIDMGMLMTLASGDLALMMQVSDHYAQNTKNWTQYFEIWPLSNLN